MSEIRADVQFAGHLWSVPGIALDWRERLGLFDRGLAPRRITLALPLGDVATLVSRGHHPKTATCRIYIGDRLVSVAPVLEMVPGRHVGEATEITVGDRPLVDRAVIPSSGMFSSRYVRRRATEIARQAQEDLWESQIKRYDLNGNQVTFRPTISPESIATVYGERSEGRLFPLIFNKPGRNGVFGAPAIPISKADALLMVAGHHTTLGTVTVRGPATATNTYQYVTIGGTDYPLVGAQPSETVEEVLTTSHSTDALGNPITIVDVSGATTLSSDWVAEPGSANADWYVAWDGTASGLDMEAADIIGFLLGASDGIPVDAGAIEAIRGYVSGYLLDCAIDAEGSPFTAFLLGQILPLLPLSLVWTLEGVGLAPIKLDYPRDQARVHLRVGDGIGSGSRPRFASSDGDIINRWTLAYSASRISRSFRDSYIGGPNRYDFAARSASIHGIVESRLETAWIYDDATAERSAAGILLRSAVDRRTIDYPADGRRWGIGGRTELTLGMPVRLTDSDERISDEVAVVTGIRRDGTQTDVISLTLQEL